VALANLTKVCRAGLHSVGKWLSNTYLSVRWARTGFPAAKVVESMFGGSRSISEHSHSRAASDAGSIDRRADGSNYGPISGSRRGSLASSVAHQEEDLNNMPMDPVLGNYSSTDEMIERLRNMDPTGRWRNGQGPRDHVTVADIEGSLEEMKEEKDPESIGQDAKKVQEQLARNTVIPKEKKIDRKLNAARMCEIENRLNMDPSLTMDDSECIPDQQCAAMVKRSLIRTYGKIKKNDHNLSQHVTSLLEERINTLKG